MNWIKPDWPLPAKVRAAVTLRSGGVSVGSYASLNPAGHVNDDPQHVQRNRQIIRDLLELPAEPVWLQQVHGIDVVKADQVLALPTADASYTDQSGVVCAVLTADCLPVLFCGDGGDKIAAAHAGWRGLQAGVIAATLRAIDCREVSVWLGPAIGPQHFEVGARYSRLFWRPIRGISRLLPRTAPANGWPIFTNWRAGNWPGWAWSGCSAATIALWPIRHGFTLTAATAPPPAAWRV